MKALLKLSLDSNGVSYPVEINQALFIFNCWNSLRALRSFPRAIHLVVNFVTSLLILCSLVSKTKWDFKANYLKRNPFIAIADFLKPLNIVVNISIIRGFKSPRSAFVNSILFYHIKTILIFQMSEFWQ